MHHIVSDGWSQEVFWRELSMLYTAYVAGQPSPLFELSSQYADFASWQRQWLQGELLDTQIAYWQQQLADLPTLQLPTDHPRPALQSFCGARYPLAVSPPLTQALKALSQRQGVTLFMTLLAALQTLLYRYTGQDDIPVGTLIANRHCVAAEELIGFFVNTLIVRTDVSGDPSFQALLGRIREVALGAYEHQDVPFEAVLEAVQPQRDVSHAPLFQVLFIFHNTPRQTPELAGLTLTPMEIDPGTAKFDLTLDLTETPEGLRGWLEYSSDLFDGATIAQIASHLQTLLAGVIAAPEQRLSALPLLTADQRHHLLVEWNAASTNVPHDQCLHQVFEAQVAQTPDAIAVLCEGAFLTYHELNGRANQVAHYLRALGVRPEMRVGLCMERCLDMVIGLLGILKAGAAYVPLDPLYPQERLAFMLEDAHISVLLTQERLVADLPAYQTERLYLDTDWPIIAMHSDQNPVNWTTADNVAYLLYTSGSTGQPKGVLGVHRAVLNALIWMWQTFPFALHEVCCQKTSISFGDFIQELLGPLLQGIRLILIPDEVRQDPRRLVHALAAHRVTRIILVPSLLRMLLHAGVDLAHRLPSLTLWIASGEALSKELLQHFRESLPHCRLINLYGASEVSDDTTWYDTGLMPPARILIPIGRPLSNVQVYVLDHHLQPVPIGVPGELYIGGAGLTRGYLHHAALTAEKFIPHPCSFEPGARLYTTGDFVRYLPEGNLEYLGRLDSQVKVRGCRIELEEIEAGLEQHPTVLQAVVGAREETPGETRLTAYLVADPASRPAIGALQRFLRQRVPVHMVPSAWIWLDALPLTPSGKVDRRALPRPDQAQPWLGEARVAPRTPTEEVLAGIWATVLGVEEVGVHDNFFDLGGHSLMAVQVMSRLWDSWQVDVPLRTLFEAPTVAGLALAVEAAWHVEQTVSTLPLRPMPRGESIPASAAQEHLWLFDQILPGTPFFNLPYALRLLGVLNVVVLEQSFNEIVRRHEVLRTTFVRTCEQLVQVIVPTLAVTLTVEDLRGFPTAVREGESQRLAQEEAQKPFDLARGPLLRIRLLRLAEQEHLLLITMHHIVSDGWSLGVLGHELAALYDAYMAGSLSPLPELPMQYGDFAYWQRQWRSNSISVAQLSYWQHQLRPPLPVLNLAPGYPRTTALSFRTARHSVDIPLELSTALMHLSRQAGSTLFMSLLAAFKMLLYSYTGQEDLWVSTLVANRTRPATEGLIGLFINTVVLRTHLGGNPTFREVLQRVGHTTLEAYAHQDLPCEELLQTLAHAGHPAGTTLCPVLFILHNARQRPVQRTTRTLHFLEADHRVMLPEVTATTFDIILELYPRPQGLVGSCIYKTYLFEAATIKCMLDHFQHLLEGIIAHPEQPLSEYGTLRLRPAL
jgi:amino acid adenylation domain-containing protein